MRLTIEMSLNGKENTMSSIVDQNMIVQTWINEFICLILPKDNLIYMNMKVKVHYEGFQIDRQAQMQDIFDQGDIITTLLTYETKFKPKLDNQKNQQNIKDKDNIIIKKKKIRKKKNKQKNKNILSLIPSIKKDPNLINSLSQKYSRILKMINFIDDYLKFSKEIRGKQSLLLSNIQQYYQQKTGNQLHIGLFNSIIKICPKLYRAITIKSLGMMVMLKGSKNRQQRKQLFLDSVLQNQNINLCISQQPNKCNKPQISSNIAPKIQISRLKNKLKASSVLFDKQFSSKIQKIVLMRQQQLKQKLNSFSSKSREYKMIIQQVQLFRILKRVNVNKQVFLNQIQKRTNCSITYLSEFIDFIKDKTNYIQQCLCNNGIIKIVVNTQLFKQTLKMIDTI